MTCKICIEWVPQSREQLENRRKNLRESPHVEVFHCPNCGGTDYMTCETRISGKPKIQWDWTIRFREWWKGS